MCQPPSARALLNKPTARPLRARYHKPSSVHKMCDKSTRNAPSHAVFSARVRRKHGADGGKRKRKRVRASGDDAAWGFGRDSVEVQALFQGLTPGLLTQALLVYCPGPRAAYVLGFPAVSCAQNFDSRARLFESGFLRAMALALLTSSTHHNMHA